MGRKELPRYVSQATLARRYQVSRGGFSNWVARYPADDEHHPTPAPDAYLEDRPLWLEDSVPAWDAWVERHRTVIGFAPEADDVVLPPPEYLTKTDLAKELGVPEQTVHAWVRRLADDDELPTPAPDLVSKGKKYWHRERLPQWEAWIEARTALVAERARERGAELGRRGYTGPHGPRLDTNRERIRAALEQRIRLRIYPPGTPLPSARALAEEFEVQDMTVNRATTELKKQGLVARVGMRLVVCESIEEGNT
jgi:GntR family transcriptional regulator